MNATEGRVPLRWWYTPWCGYAPNRYRGAVSDSNATHFRSTVLIPTSLRRLLLQRRSYLCVAEYGKAQGTRGSSDDGFAGGVDGVRHHVLRPAHVTAPRGELEHHAVGIEEVEGTHE